MSRWLLLWAGLLAVCSGYGQQVRGVVVAEDGQPLAGVLVRARHPRMELVVLASAWTDDEGRFALPCGQWQEGVLEIESSFFTLERPVAVSCGDSVRLAAVFRAQQMEDVVVKGEAIPIIDRGDTIIYRIDKLARAEDVTLEDLLRRMPDIELSEEGQVRFRGKLIDRILINGEWLVLDHALLTRTLSPQMLAGMEIRTREDNTRLKRQLLDRGPMLVLDLKLAEDVREELFGQAAPDGGAQSGRRRIDVHGNAFSLRPRLKALAYLNWDHFDKKIITGDQLRELDPEAFEEVFNLPANPDLLKKREVYHSDIFGFNDYYRREPRIAGLSVALQPHPKVEVRPTLLVALERLDRSNRSDIYLVGAPERSLSWLDEERNGYATLKSRVPIQYRMNDQNWLTIDVFFTARKDSSSMHREVSGSPIGFDEKLGWRQMNLSAKYEHQGPGGWSFSASWALRSHFSGDSLSLMAADDGLAGLFFDSVAWQAPSAFRVAQYQRQAGLTHTATSRLHRRWGDFAASLSATARWARLSTRLATTASDLLRTDRPWGGALRWQYARFYPELRLQYEADTWRLDLSSGVDQVFEQKTPWRRVAHRPFFGGSLVWSLSPHEELSVQYVQSPARVLVESAGYGVLLQGPSGWRLLSDSLFVARPRRNAQWSLNTSRWKRRYGLSGNFTGTYGQVFNAFALRVLLDEPLWQEERVSAQPYLYLLGGLVVNWQAPKRPGVKAKWESFLFRIMRENADGPGVRTQVYLHTIEWHAADARKVWAVSGKLTLRSFFSIVEGEAPVRWRQTLASELRVSRTFFEDRLVARCTWRGIEHLVGAWEPLRTFDLRLQYRAGDELSFFFEGFNLLDQRVQTKVEVDPVRIAGEEVFLFPRALRVGLRRVFL